MRPLIPIVELIRLETDKKYGTLGVLRINKQIFCCVLEPGKWGNAKDISCINTGQYLCELYDSPKYGWTYMVTDVPGRSFVLLHAGNLVKHTKGCLLLGQYFGKLANEDRATLNSGKTFNSFMVYMRAHPKFHLTITENY